MFDEVENEHKREAVIERVPRKVPVLFWQLCDHRFRHVHIVEAAEDQVCFMEGMEILLHGSMEVGGGTEDILGDRLRVKIVVNLRAQQGGIGVI